MLRLWFESGSPVPDLYNRSGDAEYILDGDFEAEEGVEACALEWRECLIPVTAFGIRSSNLEEHMLALKRGSDDSSTWAGEERERYQRIEEWMRECGGAEAALARSPLLVTIRDGRVAIEDGYHRLGLAAHRYGMTHVLSLCAVVSSAPRVESSMSFDL